MVGLPIPPRTATHPRPVPLPTRLNEEELKTPPRRQTPVTAPGAPRVPRLTVPRPVPQAIPIALPPPIIGDDLPLPPRVIIPGALDTWKPILSQPMTPGRSLRRLPVIEGFPGVVPEEEKLEAAPSVLVPLIPGRRQIEARVLREKFARFVRLKPGPLKPAGKGTKVAMAKYLATPNHAAALADILLNGKKVSGSSFFDLVEPLTPNEVALVLVMVGFSSFAGTLDDAYLFLALCYHADLAQDKALMDRLNFFASLTLDEIHSQLTQKVVGELKTLEAWAPDDWAYLVYTLGIWAKPPFNPITDPAAYERRSTLDLQTALNLARHLYGMTSVSMTTPWRHLANVENVSALEPFIAQLGLRTPAELAAMYGHFMVFPVGTADQREYFLKNIKDYELVFRRAEKPAPFTPEQVRNVEDAQETLKLFTDDELIKMFGIDPDFWVSRRDLIEKLARLTIKTEIAWFLTTDLTRAANNPYYDPVTLEEYDPEAPENKPLIAYGNIYGYRLYLPRMLEDTFRPGKGGKVVFNNPFWHSDYKTPEGQVFDDPLKVFSEASIIKLQEELMANLGRYPRFMTLLTLIDKGLEDLGPVKRYIADLQSGIGLLQAIDPEDPRFNIEYEQFATFALQLFALSMYARFWAGPPHEYPHVFVENGRDAVASPALTTPDERNQRFMDTLVLIRRSVEAYSDRIRQMINSLIILEYDWQSGDAALTTENLFTLLSDAQRGQMCLADMSDRGLKTAYVLMAKVLGWDTTEINQRLRAFLQAQTQPNFVPTQVGVTHHTDPGHFKRTIIKG